MTPSASISLSSFLRSSGRRCFDAENGFDNVLDRSVPVADRYEARAT